MGVGAEMLSGGAGARGLTVRFYRGAMRIVIDTTLTNVAQRTLGSLGMRHHYCSHGLEN